MVQGTSVRQNTNENRAPRYEALADRYNSSSRFRLNFTPLDRSSVVTTNVIPMAKAKSPLSGRNRTDTPATRPVAAHNQKALLCVVAMRASVAVKHIATAKNTVSVSVRIVAT